MYAPRRVNPANTTAIIRTADGENVDLNPDRQYDERDALLVELPLHGEDGVVVQQFRPDGFPGKHELAAKKNRAGTFL